MCVRIGIRVRSSINSRIGTRVSSSSDSITAMLAILGSSATSSSSTGSSSGSSGRSHILRSMLVLISLVRPVLLLTVRLTLSWQLSPWLSLIPCCANCNVYSVYPCIHPCIHVCIQTFIFQDVRATLFYSETVISVFGK